MLFDNQIVLDNKIDKLTAMMGKLPIQCNIQVSPLKPQLYQRKKEDKEGIITMAQEGNKADLDQTIEIGSQVHLKDVDLNINRIMGDKHLTVKTSQEEETSEGKEISEVV